MTAQTAATTHANAGSADDTLVIRGLRVAPITDRENEILQGIDLDVGKGEVHAIMGPNGSGKTTLAYALMGHPSYVVTGGEVHWKGRDILKLSPDKRSRLGMFLAFQYPTAIPGLSVASFIRSALNAKLLGVDKTGDVDPTDPQKGGISMRDFRNKMREKMAILKIDEGFAARYVNDGFSGGEKKRLEMLQMAVLEPERQVLAAALDDPALGQDMDDVRGDVVEQALVVGDQQDAELRVEHRVDTLGDDPQGVDVEARVGLVEDRELRVEQFELHDLVALLLAA